jgi:hypothetical protein
MLPSSYILLFTYSWKFASKGDWSHGRRHVQISGMQSVSNESSVDGFLEIVIHLVRDSETISNNSSGEN